MSTWECLPQEILNQVFESLHFSDVQQCSLTCRSWTSAQRILFNDIGTLDNHRMNNLPFELSSQPGQSSRSPQNYVKIVDLSGLSDSFDLELFDKLFPFLQSVRLSIRHQSLYDKFYQLALDGKFTHLQTLPYVYWNDQHIKLVMARKEQIRVLQIRDQPPDDSSVGEILQKVHLFPQLREFSLFCFNRARTFRLNSLLTEKLTKLKSINLLLVHPSILSLCLSTQILSNIQPLPNVKHLKISDCRLLNDGDAPLTYLMKTLPMLDSLELENKTDEPFEMENCSISTLACLIQFLGYLFDIKSSSYMKPLITDHFTNQVVESLFKYALEQKSQKFERINLYLTIKIDEIDPVKRKKYSPNRTAFIEVYNNFIPTKRTKICNLSTVYKKDPEDDAKTYLDLFSKIGAMELESLTIGDSEKKLVISEHVPIPLDLAFKNFTSLKELHCYGVRKLTYAEDNLLETRNVDSILEVLNLTSCGFDNDIYSFISKMCPKLKALAITRCTHPLDAPENPTGKARIFTISMPTSRLDKLYFYIELLRNPMYAENDFYAVFIRLETADQISRYRKFTLNESYSWESKSTAHHSSHSEYLSCLEDNECVVYEVYCEAVVDFTVEADVYYEDEEDEDEDDEDEDDDY